MEKVPDKTKKIDSFFSVYIRQRFTNDRPIWDTRKTTPHIHRIKYCRIDSRRVNIQSVYCAWYVCEWKRKVDAVNSEYHATLQVVHLPWHFRPKYLTCIHELVSFFHWIRCCVIIRFDSGNSFFRFIHCFRTREHTIRINNINVTLFFPVYKFRNRTVVSLHWNVDSLSVMTMCECVWVTKNHRTSKML